MSEYYFRPIRKRHGLEEMLSYDWSILRIKIKIFCQKCDASNGQDPELTILDALCCMLHAAPCMLDAAHCMLDAACWMLHDKFEEHSNGKVTQLIMIHFKQFRSIFIEFNCAVKRQVCKVQVLRKFKWKSIGFKNIQMEKSHN